jgi:aldehyde oxidoreductase
MIHFTLNGVAQQYTGNPEQTLLNHLRLDHHITSAKDGCSGQATCGACTVEIDGKAKLACALKMRKLEGTNILTMEGFPDYIKDTIVKAYVNKGAVQCGFCTPGFIARTKVLLQTHPQPSIEEIRENLKQHICRCTGYKKIEEAIVYAGESIRQEDPFGNN